MARGTLSRRLRAMVTAALIGAAIVLPSTAGAAVPSPANLSQSSPAVGGTCPQATYVVVSPGSPLQVILIVPPGPSGCPLGLDMTVGAGIVGSPAGEAVALPLTASSCQLGTAVLDGEITALGQTPGSGFGSGPPPGGGNSPCPGGDAAYSQLATLLLLLPITEGVLNVFGGGVPNFGSRTASYAFAEAQETGSLVLRLGGIYRIDTTGTPTSVLVVLPQSSFPVVYEAHASGTAGVASISCSLCSP